MISEFKPTYLMIKKHKTTGLKYFCKTVGKSPYKYKGSGVFWNRHIKKYGKDDVETIWCKLFVDQNELTDFALAFSELFDIVESKEWANLIVEDGLTGFTSENSKNIQMRLLAEKKHHLLSGEIQSNYQNKKVAEGTHRWLSGIEQKQVQQRLVDSGKHRFCDSNYQSRVSKIGNAKRIEDGTHNAIEIHTCPHCNCTGKGFVMFRHHFDNCKEIPC